MPLKTVIFDYDGVLMDSLPAVLSVYKTIGEKMNIKEFSSIQNGDFFEVHWHKHFEKVGVTEHEELKTAELLFKQEMQKYRDSIHPIAGIKEVLGKIHGRCKLAIVSNNMTELIEERLATFGMLDFFDTIVGHEYGALKPDPTQILICMQSLKVAAKDAAYIGDMDGDIEAAKRANVAKIIGVTYGFHSPHRLRDADFIIHNPQELHACLEKHI
ncbi:HAD family hydrolase [Candidatus Woesearchaeota archaeon]|nr:HAD family hydrolase [Candidatus Woesearchaeota archaeon]